MSGLLNIQDFLDPRDDLMGAWVGRFIKIDDTIFEIIFDGSFEGGGSGWDGSVVIGAYIHFVIVFE